MRVRGCVRFVHPGLPGENIWCVSRQAAKRAVSRRLASLPAGYRVLHHLNPRMGTPHYHLVDPQGNPFYAHFFYSAPATAPGDEHTVRRWQHTLGQQGFVAHAKFVRGWRQGLRAKGLRLPPARFRQAFAEARHLRQTTPAYCTRIAVWNGIAILYQRGNRADARIHLLDVLPAGASAIATPIQPQFVLSPNNQAETFHEEGAPLSADSFELQPALLPNPSIPRGRIPRFTQGEIKGLRSYRKGLAQLSGRKDVRGNDALVVYDDAGRVFMQVFRKEPGSNVRRVYWEGVIGKVPVPKAPVGSGLRGNMIEDRIRRLVQRRIGQRFMKKHPSANGPDLVTAGRHKKRK